MNLISIKKLYDLLNELTKNGENVKTHELKRDRITVELTNGNIYEFILNK
jgi:hypothetical protein